MPPNVTVTLKLKDEVTKVAKQMATAFKRAGGEMQGSMVGVKESLKGASSATLRAVAATEAMRAKLSKTAAGFRDMKRASLGMRAISSMARGAAASVTAMGAATLMAGRAMRRAFVTGARLAAVGMQRFAAGAIGGMRRLTNSILGFRGLLIGGAIGGAMVKTSLTFEREMTKIITLVGVSQKQVGAWGAEIEKMAVSVGKGPGELAKAMFFVTSAGLRGTEALEALEFAAKGSALGLGDTKVVADALTSAMNAYSASGLSAKEATAILVATVREGKAEADTLATAFGRVLPVSSALGVSFNNVGGALAAMTRLGLGAEESATALRSILNAMLKPTTQGTKMLDKLGTSYNNLRSILANDGIAGLMKEIARLTDRDAESMAVLIPNVRALTGVLSLARDEGGPFTEMMERMNAVVSGDLDVAFATLSKTSDQKLKVAWARLQVTAKRLGDALKPLVTEFANFATILVDKIINSGVLLTVTTLLGSMTRGFRALAADSGMDGFAKKVGDFVSLMIKGFALTMAAVIDLPKNIKLLVAQIQELVLTAKLAFNELQFMKASLSNSTFEMMRLGRESIRMTANLKAVQKTLQDSADSPDFVDSVKDSIIAIEKLTVKMRIAAMNAEDLSGIKVSVDAGDIDRKIAKLRGGFDVGGGQAAAMRRTLGAVHVPEVVADQARSTEALKKLREAIAKVGERLRAARAEAETMKNEIIATRTALPTMDALKESILELPVALQNFVLAGKTADERIKSLNLVKSLGVSTVVEELESLKLVQANTFESARDNLSKLPPELQKILAPLIALKEKMDAAKVASAGMFSSASLDAAIQKLREAKPTVDQLASSISSLPMGLQDFVNSSGDVAERVRNLDLVRSLGIDTLARQLEQLNSVQANTFEKLEKNLDKLPPGLRAVAMNMLAVKRELNMDAELESAQQSFRKFLDDNKSFAMAAARFMQSVMTSFANAVSQFVAQVITKAFEGQIKTIKDVGRVAQDVLKSLFTQIIAELVRLAVTTAITKAIAGFAADGGVAIGGITPVRAFAEGGIVNRPTIGIVGEGKDDEAIIPLKGGAVPVKFTGADAGGAGRGESFTVNISANDAKSFADMLGTPEGQEMLKAQFAKAKREDRRFNKITRGGA